MVQQRPDRQNTRPAPAHNDWTVPDAHAQPWADARYRARRADPASAGRIAARRKEIGVIEAVEVVSIGPSVQRHRDSQFARLMLRQSAFTGAARRSWLQDFTSCQPLAVYAAPVRTDNRLSHRHTELIRNLGVPATHVDRRRRHLASGFNPHERQLPALFVHLTETRPGSLPTPGVQPGGRPVRGCAGPALP